MEIFLKSAAGTLVALIMYLILIKQGKDISTLLTVAVCSMVAIGTMQYITPVISFINQLQSVSNLDPEIMQIILRSVGIALLSEITSTICADAGNTALGKALQLLAAAVILWLAVPLFSKLIDLIEELLLVT